MKIEIDTTNKTVKVIGTATIKELTETLEKFMPDGAWKDYSLQENNTFTYYPYYPVYPTVWPSYPVTYATQYALTTY